MNPLTEGPVDARAGRRVEWKVRRGLAAFMAVVALAVGACDDGAITDPPIDDDDMPAQAAPYTAIVAWNELARNLVAAHGTAPPVAARAFALLSVAQYEALLRLRGAVPSADASLDATAVTAASTAVLSYLYPVEANALDQRAARSRIPLAPSGVRSDVDVSAAIAAGTAAAEVAIERAREDGAADGVEWHGEIPEGPDKWLSSAEPPQPPLLPGWGGVRPWLMESGDQFRPPPPPAMDSPAFAEALAEVRRFSDERTVEQQHIAEYWADGPGTFTPPGHWNEIATDLIEKHEPDALEAARALAYMNMAVMDAGISCWDAKYAYWLLRPSQADPEITLAVELPNFPAYTSGHSSFSGAAADVLAYFFASESASLAAMGDEAAISRVYGGIHYRFDSDRALEQGRAIAQLAIARAEAEAASEPAGLISSP